jgi:hypothetical protein
VDHQIEDDVDIERTGREYAKAVRLKKHGPRKALSYRKHSRIKALEVTGLDDTGFFCPLDKIISLLKICGQGFFNEHVDSGVKKLSGHGVMMHSGHGDAGGIEIEIGGEELFDGWKNRNLVLRRSFLGASRIGLDGGNKRYAFTGQFQFAIDAEMIAAECARAGNGYAQLACTGYFAASFTCGASGDSP